MRENRKHGSNFEEKLLDELKTVVARRGAEQEVSTGSAPRSPGRRRAPRLALAAAGLAAAAAVLVFSSGGGNTSKAFAVEPQPGGGVTIKIYSPEDPAGLEGALAEAGIRSQVTWLPAGTTCREPHFTQSSTKTSAGGSIGGLTMGGPGEAMTIGVMSSEQWQERWREHTRGEISDDEYFSSTPNISLDPASFRADQTVVISGSRGAYGGDPEGGFEVQLAVAEGPVQPCEPVNESDGGLLGRMNRVLKSESTAQGKAATRIRELRAKWRASASSLRLPPDRGRSLAPGAAGSSAWSSRR